MERNVVNPNQFSVYIPANKINEINVFNKNVGILEKKYQRTLTSEEIAKELDMPVKTVDDYLIYKMSTVSLDQPVNSNEELGETIADFIPDDEMNLEETVFRKIVKEDIQELFNALSERERKVIEMRYGFYDDKQYTLEEMGEYFDVSRERIRQIEAKAIYKMQLYTKRHKLSKELKIYI